MLLLFSITWGPVSGWWTLGCLGLGIIFAMVLYSQPTNINKKASYLLAALRALTVAVITLLLLSPMLKSVTSRPEKPLVLVVMDNSSSIQLFKPAGFDPVKFVDRLGNLKSQLGADYDVREFNFAADLKQGLSKTFNGKQTDIERAFHGLYSRFANQNIGAVVVATDGIYNKGADPQYIARNLKTNIYTIALGDTIPKRDLLIANVNYNKTAFLGNDFEVEVLAEAYQSKGENMRMAVTEDGNLVDNKTVGITANSFRQSIPLKLHADKKGIHKFTFSLQPVKNEISTANNTETVYVEVLDAKQKILILYNSPHPDITAIKHSLENNRNYEVKATQLNNFETATLSTYNVVILYQLPAQGVAMPLSIQMQLTSLKTPTWYIVGAQSNLQQLNSVQKLVQISPSRPDMQEVFAIPKADFSAFTLSDSTRRELLLLPPLYAPFGSYNTSATQTVLLKQRISSVETTYPLLAFGDEVGQRIAVLTAEGLWKWRLAEFETQGNTHSVDELMSQSVQYLTASDNHNRFRVYPARNVFNEGDDAIINAELYNDALALVNTPDVKIELKSKAGKTYSFLLSRNGQSYQLNAGALPAGEYSYTANTKLSDKTLIANGQFAIKALNAETRQSAANYQMLYQLAKENGGQMLMPSAIDQLAALIRKNDNIKTVVYDDKSFRDLVDEKWVFVLIIGLISLEWFLRKRAGEV